MFIVLQITVPLSLVEEHLSLTPAAFLRLRSGEYTLQLRSGRHALRMRPGEHVIED